MSADHDVEPEVGECNEVEFQVDAPKSCSWNEDRRHIGGQGASFTGMLAMIREEYDGRVDGPGANMQAAMVAPSTPGEWRDFAGLWLFGPPKPVQGTLDRWLWPRA